MEWKPHEMKFIYVIEGVIFYFNGVAMNCFDFAYMLQLKKQTPCYDAYENSAIPIEF